MATNLVSLVMQFLTPNTISRIAAALGLEQNKVQAAIGAAVPGLLAGFSSVAAQPEGAQRLADAAKQQTSTFGSLADMIGGAGQSSLIDKGTQMLSSLLGGHDQMALAGAVGRFAGVGQNAGGSLLGMLTPVVMGTIAKEEGARNLDASHVAGLFTSQSGNIAAALPKGFSSLLGDTHVLDSLNGATRAAAAMGNEAVGAGKSAVRAMGDAGQRVAATAPSLNWLFWLIPALAVLALLVYLLNRPAEQVVQQGTTAVQSLTVGGLDIAKQVTGSIADLRTTLNAVTDTASAQVALPKLRDITAQIDKVDGLLGQLSAEQRRTLTGLVSPLMSTINQLFDRVLAIPGVAEVLKPAIDGLRAKLQALASA